MERSRGRFEYQCGQIGWKGAGRREETANEGLWQDSGRDGEREICHLLSVPPAPLSCILPGGKYALMSEGGMRGKG